jgi:hypothetical protein
MPCILKIRRSQYVTITNNKGIILRGFHHFGRDILLAVEGKTLQIALLDFVDGWACEGERALAFAGNGALGAGHGRSD